LQEEAEKNRDKRQSEHPDPKNNLLNEIIYYSLEFNDRNLSEDLRVDGKIILKWISCRVWTGFIWLL
jgi:hypothetical protein